MRFCDACTKCCDGWLPTTIFQQQVTIGSPCQFASTNGCAIYDQRRPKQCLVFECVWLADNQSPDWIKPDKSGVIADFMPKNGEPPTELWVTPAGSAVTQEYRAWAKMYALSKGLQYMETSQTK